MTPLRLPDVRAHLARLFEDRSVRWLAAARLIPLVVAPFSLYLLITRQSVSLRGFYLIAINVVMLAQLFETGMGTLIVQFAARARPVDRGLVRGAAEAWFTRMALGGLALGATLGTVILAQGAGTMNIPFLLPWVIVLSCTAAYVRLVPPVCLLEGSGHVDAVQRMRAVQATLVALATLGGLWHGRGIGAAAAAAVAQLVPALAFVWTARRHLPAPDAPVGRLAAQYRVEQWRSATVWLAIWVAPQLLTPAAMALRGPAVAGDLGVHVALAFAPAILSVAWLHARYPRLGALVAAGAVRTFDDTARDALRQAMTVFGVGSAALIGLAIAVPWVLPSLGSHVLSVRLLTFLLAGNLMIVLFQAMLAWIRAFGDERLATPVAIACVAMAMGGVGGTALAGATGAAAGYAFVGAIVSAILVTGFLRLRAQRLAGA